MLCESIEHARYIFQRFADYPWCVWDTETVPKRKWFDRWIKKTGKKKNKEALILGRMQVILFSLCYMGEAYSFPTNLISGEYCTPYDYFALPEFKALLKKLGVFHNANYDLNVFENEDAEVVFKNFWCTAIGVWLANPAKNVGLKDRAPLYGRHLHKTDTIDFAKIGDIDVYAEEDVVQTDECFQMQRFGFISRPKYIFHVGPNGKTIKTKNPMPYGKIVIEKEDLGDFEKLWMKYTELPYLKTTIKAEKMGFPFNREKCAKIERKIVKRKKKILRRIYRAAGKKINLGSHPQKTALFMKLGIKSPNVSRKTGKPSYAAGALVKIQMAGGHKIITDIQAYSALDKLGKYSSPISGLPHFVNERGRIRAYAKTTGAVTGRGSSSNPNLQQIPAAKDQYGFKDCFEAPKGKLIVCLDHSQLELRVMAILSGEWRMANILNDPDRDIHGEMANDASVDRDPTAKQLNFLLQFAGTAWALAEKLTIEGHPTTPEQAQVWVDRYNEVRPNVVAYRKSLLVDHQEQGFVRLLTGRRRWLEGVRWNSKYDVHKAETTLSNNVVQGSGQDLLKAAVIRCDWNRVNPDRALPQVIEMRRSHRLLLKDYARRLEKIRGMLKKGGTRFALQVHDEGLWFADKSCAEDMGHYIAEVMCWKHYFPPIVKYNTLLAVDGGIGQTWQQAKGKKEKPLAKIEARATYAL